MDSDKSRKFCVTGLEILLCVFLNPLNSAENEQGLQGALAYMGIRID